MEEFTADGFLTGTNLAVPSWSAVLKYIHNLLTDSQSAFVYFDITPGF